MNTFEDGAYDARRLKALEDQGRAIKAAFARAGYEAVEPAVIQPADVFLNRSGEAMRRQMFVFSDISGEELCLRPEFTIPVCRIYLSQTKKKRAPMRLCYNGSVFRSEGAPVFKREFHQTGVEYIGDKNRERADAEVLSLAIKAIKAAGLKEFQITVGSLQLVWGFLEKLSLPAHWRARLRRHFSKPARFAGILESLASGAGSMDEKRRAIFTQVAGLNSEDARACVEDIFKREDISVLGGRSIEEIAERFLEQAADMKASPLPPNTVTMIEDFLSIRGPLEPALARVEALAARAEVVLDPEIKSFRRSLKGLKLPGGKPLLFAADLGRGIDYYTGFVFELRALRGGKKSRQGPIASGGRYDRLLGDLGAAKALPAVGCAIHSERLLDTRRS